VVAFTSSSTFNASYLAWTNGTNNGAFNMTVDTRNISAGTYTLSITFSRTNYTAVIQDITLTISTFQPTAIVPTGILSFIEGDMIVVPITVTDGLLHETFEAIQINWAVPGTSLSGSITSVNASGEYYITFSSSLLPANANYNLTISVQVIVDGYSYSLSSSQLVNFRVEYPTILGIPAPYFWALVIGIAAVLGIFIAYRSIKYARIPQIIKDIERTRADIKKRRSIEDVVISTTKEESLYEMVAGDWATIGVELKAPPPRKAATADEGQNAVKSKRDAEEVDE
jgi:hypothetical protein